MPLSNVKLKWKIFSNFVAFSEYPNFNQVEGQKYQKSLDFIYGCSLKYQIMPYINNALKIMNCHFSRLAAPSTSRSSSSNPASTASRRSRPSPSPTRRSRPTTQATIPVGGHTSVKMSTKRKSPGRTVINPSNTSKVQTSNSRY